MRAIIQRVSRANVRIDGKIHGEIGDGLLVFLAVNDTDNDDIMKWFCNKIVNLRIFPDEKDKMNRSVLDIGGSILLISNFTLYGDIRHGFRPSFTRAAPPEIAEPMYNKILNHLRDNYPVKVEAGLFGAMMDIELVNAGPVTISIEKEG